MPEQTDPDPSPQSPSDPQPPPDQKKPVKTDYKQLASKTYRQHKTFIYVIVGLIGLIFAAILGFFILSLFTGDPTPPSSPGIPVPSPTPADPTANWPIYQDPEYYFSVKYPDHLYPQVVAPEVGSAYNVLVTNSPDQKPPTDTPSPIHINIAVGGETTDGIAAEYGNYTWTKGVIKDLNLLENGSFQHHPYNFGRITRSKAVNLGSLTGFKYRVDPLPDTDNREYTTLSAALASNGRSFLISARTDDELLMFTPSYQRLFDLILSTFKYHPPGSEILPTPTTPPLPTVTPPSASASAITKRLTDIPSIEPHINWESEKTTLPDALLVDGPYRNSEAIELQGTLYTNHLSRLDIQTPLPASFDVYYTPELSPKNWTPTKRYHNFIITIPNPSDPDVDQKGLIAIDSQDNMRAIVQTFQDECKHITDDTTDCSYTTTVFVSNITTLKSIIKK